MPVSTIEAPNGKTLKVEHPADATDQEIISYAERHYQDPNEGSGFKGAVKRGLARTDYSLDYAAFNLGLKDSETFAEDTSKFIKKMREVPMSQRTKDQLNEIYSSKNPAQFVWNLATNPIGVGNLLTENLASVAPAGAIAGGTGLALRKLATQVPLWLRTGVGASIFGTQSGALEASQKMFNDMTELGIDVNDPEMVQVALEDKDTLKYLRNRSLKWGASPAAFDAITFGIAGLPTRTFTKNFTDLSREALGRAAVAELGTQGIGGALGAAGSQLIVEGEITDPIDIGLEFALELISGGPQAAYNIMTTHGLDNPLMEDVSDTFLEYMGKHQQKVAKVRDTLRGAKEAVKAIPQGIETAKQKYKEETATPERGEDPVGILGMEQVDLLSTKPTKSKDKIPFKPEYTGVRLTPGARDFITDKINIEGAKPEIFSTLDYWTGKNLEQGETVKKEDVKEFLRNRTYKGKQKEQIQALWKKQKAAAKAGDVTRAGYFNEAKKALMEEFGFEQGAKPHIFKKVKAEPELKLDGEKKKKSEPIPVVDPQEMGKSNKKKSAEEINELGKTIRALENEKQELENREQLLDQMLDDGFTPDNVELSDTQLEEMSNEFYENRARQKEIETEVQKLKSEKTNAQRSTLFVEVPVEKFKARWGNTIGATELTAQQKTRYKTLMRAIRGELESMLGPYAKDTKIEFVDRLVDLSEIDLSKVKDPNELKNVRMRMLRGAQWNKQIVIALSLDPNNPNPDILETAFHEGIHAILDAGLWDNPRVKNLVLRDAPRYRDLLAVEFEMDSSEFEAFLATDEGLKELTSVLGGILMSKWSTEGKISKGYGLTKESKSLFQRIFDALKRIWSAVRKQPFDLEDMFIRDFPVAMTAIQDIIDDGVRREDAAGQEIKAKVAKDVQQQALEKMDEEFKEWEKDLHNTLPVWMRTLYSKRGLSEHHPALKWLYSISKAKDRAYHSLAEKYQAMFDPYWKMPKKNRYAMTEIAHTMKVKGMKNRFDEDTGLVTVFPYTEKGRENEAYTFNKDQSQAYMAMQNATREVLNDFERLYKNEVLAAFPDLPENFSLEDVQSLLADEDIKNSESQVETLKNISKTLKEFKAMKNQDYVPELRIGEFGVVVFKKLKAKTEAEAKSEATNEENIRQLKKNEWYEKVFFDAVERYSPKAENRYHPEQMKRIKDEIVANNFNSSDYVINPKVTTTIGPDGKKITKVTGQSLDNLDPFHLTNNLEESLINIDSISIDILMGIMASPSLHKGEAYREAMEELSVKGFNLNELLLDKAQQAKAQTEAAKRKRGFSTRFRQSQNILGYSKDWDRVWRSYFQSAARSGAYLRYKNMTEHLVKEARTNLAKNDPWLSDYAENYIKYVNDPAEDWQKVRAGNFFWTMGMAPITALLQYMNLGTTSLGIMHRYNPSTIQNMGKLSKWLFLSHHFVNMNNIEWRDGSPVVRWDNPEIWAKKIRPALQKTNDKGELVGMTDEQYNTFKSGFINAFRSGLLGAALVEESATTTLTSELTKKEKLLSTAEKAIQFTGVLIAIAEQQSRVTSHAAILDLLLTNPDAAKRARKVLKGEGMTQEEMARKKFKPNQVFDAHEKMHPELTFEQSAAQHAIEDSHAVFGKTARPEAFKGVWGAVPLAFQTWPHQIWGLMKRMAMNEGSEGKIALGVLLTSFFAIGGITGFPGGEEAKEMFEFLYKSLTDREIDIINNIHERVGMNLVGETVTHGLNRSLLGLNMSQRLGLGIPGGDVMLSAVGAIENPQATLGVLGSVIAGAQAAADNYKNEAGFWRVAPDLLPTTLSNIVKSVQYQKEGVITRKGTQIATPDQVSVFDSALKFFGAESANLARYREQKWFSQVLNRENQGKYTRITNKIVNNQVNFVLARREGNEKRANKYKKRMHKNYRELRDFVRDQKEYIDLADIQSRIATRVGQRLTGGLNYQRIRTNSRYEVREMEKRIEERINR